MMMSTSDKFEIIHEALSQENSLLCVTHLCDIAGVSRSGYYRWVGAVETREERERKDQDDFEKILIAFNHRGYSKGARGVHMNLLHQDPPVRMNLKKIRRLMSKYNLYCPIRRPNPYRRMAKSVKSNNVADNIVNREFKKSGPRSVLLTDITYIPYNGRFAYLSTILDAYTKQILAYVLSDSLEVDFVLDTVNQLIENHQISLQTNVLIHSDQGAHYTSCSFIQLIRDKGLRQSMSRRGNCWDNAPQESFYGHMKDVIDISKCMKFTEVKEIIDDWMDYYNNERYQWNLAKLSPNQYYEYIMTGIYPLKTTENE